MTLGNLCKSMTTDPTSRHSTPESQPRWEGAGGTPGGVKLFALGFVLAAVGVYLLLDSVRVTSDNAGLFSGTIRGFTGDGAWHTTSMGILFVPFLAGVALLFYNSRLKLGWGLLYFGLAVIMVEIFSQIRFVMNVKVTMLLLMLALIGAGVGLMVRAVGVDTTANRSQE